MAYGIYSFKDQQSAQGFLNEQGKGKLMTAKELDSHSWERNMEMIKEKKKEHMQNMSGK
jgi:copper chaperone NosL